MKPYFILVLLAFWSGAFAQRGGGTPTGISSYNSGTLNGLNDPFFYGKGIDINSAKYSEVNGSPFLKQDYTPAFVAFKNGRLYSDVPIKFDMLHNEIDIDRNGTLISLLGLDSISYPDSVYQIMILKAGYPSVSNHDTGSIYQIVAQNNTIQLLKYYHCHISTIRTLGFPDKSTFDVDKQYYLFDKATKKIKEVKLDKKSLPAAITDMGYSRVEIDKHKNVNFKNEKDVAALISSLNL